MIAFGAGTGSVATGDFNGDGHLDLAVANEGSETVSILLGTGTGSFGAASDFGVGTNPESVGVGDFNGDGHLDLGVANAGSGTLSILLNTCAGPPPILDGGDGDADREGDGRRPAGHSWGRDSSARRLR